ncbi:hypothetical protein CYMTET_20604 [Cymbomonas tetramitiformis]|uniref:Uncharacterized protein n=1 Tax=Cymbomonas tetramitiformis TaxID=36881 RepID=A0AAE0L404_9CHLO|nr:hypothetical protein CYMTET_20604 [Cymbomonas tetramitiformis]
MGEVYDAKLKVCTECSPGTIKFNNDTAACSGCDAVPEGSLTCPGGSNFTVGQGAWIAPNAQHCPDAACFLNRVYECEVAEACENGNEAQRSGSQLADAVGLQAELCSPEHYSGPDTVVCGGHVPVVCRARQFRVSAQARCQPCPAVVSLLASVVGCLLLVIGVIMLLLWIFGASTHSAEANSSTALMDMTQDMAIQAQKLSEMLSLVLGYLQVTVLAPQLGRPMKWQNAVGMLVWVPEDHTGSLWGDLRSCFALDQVIRCLQVMSQLTGIRERDLASTSIDPGYQF